MSLSNRENINLTHMMAGGENKYYTHNSVMGYSNNILDCYLLGECFLIEKDLPRWELKQETKTIQGFLCYKAILKNPRTGKQNLEAWYTPKIPYQYGVMNYFGLPGLILEINKNTFSITATKIELNPIKKIVIEKPSKKIKKLTQKEFKALTKKSMPGFYKKN
jgi:GLPGLI family protein